MKKKLNFLYFTPKKGVKVVPLFRWGQWIEIFAGETMIADKSNRKTLEMAGLVECGSPRTYRTIREALKTKVRITPSAFTE